MERSPVLPSNLNPEPPNCNGSAGPGAFIAVEGIDGAGKTTLVAQLADYLSSQGRPARTVTRYMILELTRLWQRLVEADAVDQNEAAALAVADTYMGLAQSVQPALTGGEIVVADRYIYSHKVHFALREVSLAQLGAWFAAALEPDLVIYLDVPVDLALERLRTKNKPDFWECGLDYRLGASIGKAWRRFNENKPPAVELATHFRSHQARAQALFQRILPPAKTMVLDGTLAPDKLLACCVELMAQLPAMNWGGGA